MDIRAWEQRASALGGVPYEPDYDVHEEDEGYFDKAGEAVSQAEFEELLFQRVLDKIRVARAAGNSDVQLSAEEIEAYQSRLHGSRSPAARPQPMSRSPVLDDTASMLSADTGRHGHSSSRESKSKKSQRTSLFSSKPKKEKPTSRKRAVSTVSSGSSQVPPGFVVPGPDGQPMYTPINPYQGSLARDAEPPSRPSSRSASGNSQAYHAPPRMAPPWEMPREVPGAFPGAFAAPSYAYRSATPTRQGRPAASQQTSYEDAGPHSRSSSTQPPKLIPFPIEPYQYHSFSPTSSSSQPSPQLQYTRRPSAPPSEASYTSMPRRIPVPIQRTATVPTTQPSYSDPVMPQASYSGAFMPDPEEFHGAAAVEVIPQPVPVTNVMGTAIGRDGERKRKGGKSKKRT
ncbi:hypothetical protein EK21DRAFT_55746 [Setomelanomma holmii]|uniref:Uncharacterized protein n=1 Tax=Setomelanomma holmii TaxID=210430 RepID=A0A9P4LTH5_9PLEO|nr:hypothetical protein EK21DRAFT_55746 [Setomelanomma holmii]